MLDWGSFEKVQMCPECQQGLEALRSYACKGSGSGNLSLPGETWSQG